MTSSSAWVIRQKCALGLLVIAAIAYAISWHIDPYVFGFTVLGLVWFQFGLAAIGVAGRLAGREVRWMPNALVWLVDVLLVSSGVGALAFLRTISWA